MSDPKSISAHKPTIEYLKSYLDKGRASLASILPQHMTAERMIKLATVAASKDHKLMQCEPMSLLRALMDSGQVGLEPFTPLQHAYIIPYMNNKKNQMEAQFQIGYRGLIELVRRSDKIASIEAHVVYENDEFDCVLGTKRTLYHKPKWTGERGKMVLVYAVAMLKDGSCQFDVMGKNAVDEIRKKSRSANNGPWVDFYDEMAKKTVIKRLIKYLPISIEAQKAIAADNRHEEIVGIDDSTILEIDLPDMPEIEVEAKETVHEKEDQKALKERRDKIHKMVKEMTLPHDTKSEILNKLVMAPTKKDLDDIEAILVLHAKG